MGPHTVTPMQASVIFLDTDYKFQLGRVMELAERRIVTALGSGQGRAAAAAARHAEVQAVLDQSLARLSVAQVDSMAQLVATLHTLGRFRIASHRNNVLIPPRPL